MLLLADVVTDELLMSFGRELRALITVGKLLLLHHVILNITFGSRRGSPKVRCSRRRNINWWLVAQFEICLFEIHLRRIIIRNYLTVFIC